ncbi:YetF domain-containing protein [Radiobacillus sp. PE A8.2]|uniref:YetF domain-containing protein n=1 Tax=Radiobacillus sp. PE A8.2 TaxID=3380349 RepID=UPI00389024A6
MEVSELSLRIAISFIVLLALTRVMGRKELSQMTFFNFVSGIAIGSIAASLAVIQDLSIRNGIIALVGWAAFTLVTGLIDIKSKSARTVLEGQPLILIKNGQVMEDVLRKARLDMDALNAILRKKYVFSISDVQYAIFETDGKISVMKKDYKQSITKADMNIEAKPNIIFDIPTTVVSDGKMDKKNLDKLNRDEKWLEVQLAQYGVTSIEDVFFAQVQTDGTLYVDQRNDVVH